MVEVPSAVLGTNKSAFFRLNQQIFTKLQVLMPGETNSPGSVNAKVGTPASQTVGVPFSVTVNAIDNSGHIVNSSDVIHLTSSDAGATLPADAALSRGTATFTVTFSATGSYTITATDVTDSSKSPSTGATTTVTQ